jgi:hypothetical protein
MLARAYVIKTTTRFPDNFSIDSKRYAKNQVERIRFKTSVQKTMTEKGVLLASQLFTTE